MHELQVCIAVPSITDFYFTPRRHSSLGVHLLTGLLRERGLRVTLLDFPATARRLGRAKLPESIDHVRPYLDSEERGPLSFFTGYRRLGNTPDRQAERIAEQEPDAVLLGCFAFAYGEDALASARAVRRRLPSTPIVIGGAGPTVHPRYYLEEEGVDAVVTGPAETTVDRLVSLIREGRPPSQRTISATEGCSSKAPFLASYRRGVLTTRISRGCPKRCAFCSVHLTEGDGYHLIPPEELARGLAQNAARPVEVVNFEDDNLPADRRYFEEIVAVIRRYHPGAELRAENGLDASQLGPEDLDSLKRAGFRHINLSLGTLDRAASIRHQRPPAADHIGRLVAEGRRIGLAATVHWICGLATDTVASVVETLHYLAALECTSGISLFYPVPGLRGFSDRGRFPRPNATLTKGSSAFPWNRSLTTAEMVTAFRLSRLINLLHDPRPEHRELVRRCLTTGRLHTCRPEGRIEPVRDDRIAGPMASDFFAGLPIPAITAGGSTS